MSQEILDALSGKFDELKKSNEVTIANEVKGLGVADLKEKQDKISADMDAVEVKFQAEKDAREALEVKNAEFQAGMEELKAAMAREGEGFSQGEEADLHTKAAELFIRSGKEALSADEIKALSTDSDPDGGYRLAATQLALISNFVFETSPMRKYASVMNTSAPDVTINVSNGGSNSGWVGEKQLRTETETAKFQQKRIVPFELYSEPRVSNKIIDDAAFDVEQWLSNEVASDFARTENNAFVTGDGVEKPKGFLTYPAGGITADSSLGKIQQIASGDANLITSDGLIALEGAVKDKYLQGSNFFLNRTSITAIRTLKDGQGNYIWSPGFNGKTDPTILGYGYARFEDMPQQGANALAIAFGNMKDTYQIIDRKGIGVLRDPYTANPQVKFTFTKRVGGDVKNFEALKLMKIEA